jgi:ribosomal protein S18 acetylase RimI-like enzyme
VRAGWRPPGPVKIGTAGLTCPLLATHAVVNGDHVTRSALSPPLQYRSSDFWEAVGVADLRFRSAVLSDVEAVLAFWKIAAEDSSRPADTAEALERLVRRDAEALTLVVDDDVIVGSVIAGWDGWRCHLYRLAVHPQYRRGGIARALLARAEARFATLGGTRADAMVLDNNDSAHDVWTNTGYRRQPTWSRWIKPIEPSAITPSKDGG